MVDALFPLIDVLLPHRYHEYALDYHESMRLSIAEYPVGSGAKEPVHQQYFDYQDDEKGGRRAFGDVTHVPVGVERTDARKPRIHEV